MNGSAKVEPIRSVYMIVGPEFERMTGRELTSGMCGCIAALMVAMEGDVEAEIFSEVVVVAKTEHVYIIA